MPPAIALAAFQAALTCSAPYAYCNPCSAPLACADPRGLREEEVARQRQLLLTEYYRKTGPAKCRAAAEHIRDLLEKGGWARAS